jgi:hypothetical protein
VAKSYLWERRLVSTQHSAGSLNLSSPRRTLGRPCFRCCCRCYSYGYLAYSRCRRRRRRRPCDYRCSSLIALASLTVPAPAPSSFFFFVVFFFRTRETLASLGPGQIHPARTPGPVRYSRNRYATIIVHHRPPTSNLSPPPVAQPQYSSFPPRRPPRTRLCRCLPRHRRLSSNSTHLVPASCRRRSRCVSFGSLDLVGLSQPFSGGSGPRVLHYGTAISASASP